MVTAKIKKLIKEIKELGYNITPGEVEIISVVLEDRLKDIIKKNAEFEKRIEALEKTPAKINDIEELECVEDNDAEELEEL
jgi:hypothetical protein